MIKAIKNHQIDWVLYLIDNYSKDILGQSGPWNYDKNLVYNKIKRPI